MNFKERLKYLRKSKKLFQKDLANELGLNQKTISNYEKGERQPDLDTLNKIAKYFDVSLDFLMGTSNIKNPYKDKENKQDTFPEEFTDSIQARAYVNKHQIFGSGGFDADKLDDNEILEFANALLEQMKMVSYKYKK